VNLLPDYSYSLLLQKNLIPVTALYRRDDFNKTSGYDINMKDGWEDWEFWLSLLNRKSEVIKLKEYLFFYRRKEVSRNQSITNSQINNLRLYIHHKHIDKYRRNSTDLEVVKYRISLLKAKIMRQEYMVRIKSMVKKILNFVY
jgi:hypothetical protein